MKSIYAASLAITAEKLEAKKGKMSKTRIRTTTYLRKVDKTPEADTLEYLGMRYIG